MLGMMLFVPTKISQPSEAIIQENLEYTAISWEIEPGLGAEY
jgi:hypothetical protein